MNKTAINTAAREIVDICRNGIIPCTTSPNAMQFQLEEHFAKLKLLVDAISKEVSGVQAKGSKAEVQKVSDRSKQATTKPEIGSKAEVQKVKTSRQRAGKQQGNSTETAA